MGDRRWAVVCVACVVFTLLAGTANGRTAGAALPTPRLRGAVLPVDALSPRLTPAATSVAAASTTPKPTVTGLTSFHRMVVDDAHHHVFITGGAPSGGTGLVVMNFSAGIVSTSLTDEGGAAGLALVGSTLYVARCPANVIDVIDTTTLTRTASIPVSGGIGGTCDFAVTLDKIWFEQGASLASLDLGAGNTVTAYGLGAGATFATSPANPNILVTGDNGVRVYDVSGTTPNQTVAATPAGTSSIDAMTMTRDGAGVIVAATGRFDELSVTDLSVLHSWPLPSNDMPEGSALTLGGKYLAVGAYDNSITTYARPDVLVYPAAATAPQRGWDFPEARINYPVTSWTAFSGDATRLFVVTSDAIAGIVRFRALPDPLKLPDTIGLTTSRSTLTYGAGVTLTAHLAAWGTVRTVSVWKRPYGGSTSLVARGSVGARGGFSVSYRPTRNTTFWATYAGDAKYVSAASPVHTVSVRVIVHGALSGFYATSAGYHLYHSGTNPLYTAAVIPVHVHKCMTFVLEKYTSSGWLYATKCFATNVHGTAHAYLIGLARGARYRIGAAFQDADHVAAGTTWSYFRVTL